MRNSQAVLFLVLASAFAQVDEVRAADIFLATTSSGEKVFCKIEGKSVQAGQYKEVSGIFILDKVSFTKKIDVEKKKLAKTLSNSNLYKQIKKKIQNLKSRKASRQNACLAAVSQPQPTPVANTTPTPIPTNEATASPTNTPQPTATPFISTRRIPIILAQGFMGRTTISCDDGQTWVANRSFDLEGDPMVCSMKQEMRCEGECYSALPDGSCLHQAQCDCGHHTGFGKGVAFGPDRMIASFGWGKPLKVLTSKNGVDWSTSFQAPQSDIGGVGYAKGHYVIAGRDPWSPYISSDGLNWILKGGTDFRTPTGNVIYSIRNFKTYDWEGGRMMAVADGDMLYTSDGAETWVRPKKINTDCSTATGLYGSMSFGNDILILVAFNGNICRSLDGGDTWEGQMVAPNGFYTHSVWNGSKFLAWSKGKMYSSSDGWNWTATDMKTDVSLSAVGISESGVLVASNNFWVGHETQKFYRSMDGLTWTELPANAYVASHAITSFTSGYADNSAVCP